MLVYKFYRNPKSVQNLIILEYILKLRLWNMFSYGTLLPFEGHRGLPGWEIITRVPPVGVVPEAVCEITAGYAIDARVLKVKNHKI